ncbi:MAG TPA: YkgJ family cysteine cluster protein [Methanosarcinales archaeon]|nr:YkgJ family cysteine cluster protein [Methanosarcinales archaeon]
MRFNILDAVNYLKVKLSMADKLSINEMAKQLVSIGFECMRCGECCRARSGDNTVILFPDEIRLIMDTHGMTPDDVCEHSIPQFIDDSGILHCFEWVLKRHSSGDCIFIQADNNCMLYQQRPWICSTYPFFLGFTNGGAKPDIIVSECKGVGRPMNEEDAIKLAELLKGRLLAEITEEIRLLENLEGFEDWEPARFYSSKGCKGYTIAVHDSSGMTYITD